MGITTTIASTTCLQMTGLSKFQQWYVAILWANGGNLWNILREGGMLNGGEYIGETSKIMSLGPDYFEIKASGPLWYAVTQPWVQAVNMDIQVSAATSAPVGLSDLKTFMIATQGGFLMFVQSVSPLLYGENGLQR